MKKILMFALVLLLSFSLFGCKNGGNETQPGEERQNKAAPQQTDETANQKAVKDLVENFGKKFQMVSLQAPEDVLKKSMQENYGDFVSQALLAKWISDPLNAPGRKVSSPWPDRIEIQSIKKLAENKYEVKGEIIEITSVEKEKGGAAAKQPITLIVEKINNKWLINDVTLGAYEEAKSIVYKNTQYGFNFPLPESWKNYEIVTGKWEGLSINDSAGEKVVETGPMISIRHPLWTSANPRQDIPIMVFTLAQWNSLQKEEFHIGAAPIGPSELGRNNKYVFALPARYNFAFPTGFEEVEDILKGKPLQPINIGDNSSR